MLVAEIETPALLIEESILERNIDRMQEYADRSHRALRPHIKTHKSVDIARMQIARGASGIAVAKLAEAEIMARHGIADIQIANEVIGESKIRRLVELARSVKISCAVDSAVNARELSDAFSSDGRLLSVLVEIDTGLHRCGLSDPAEIIDLCQTIVGLPGLRLAGIMTHAGHAYAASDRAEVERIARSEGDTMVRLAEQIRGAGISIEVVSVGSTPTAPYAGETAGVTELRVGNYVFNDMVQISLGVAAEQDCALTVLATIISCPAAGRVVIDAGSKALTSEQGAHGSRKVGGFGSIQGRAETVTRLSEEHGVLVYESGQYRLGERIRIVPNHACAVVNQFDYAYVVNGDRVVRRIVIDARGQMT